MDSPLLLARPSFILVPGYLLGFYLVSWPDFHLAMPSSAPPGTGPGPLPLRGPAEQEVVAEAIQNASIVPADARGSV